MCIIKAFTNITSRDAVITNRGRGVRERGKRQGHWLIAVLPSCFTPHTHRTAAQPKLLYSGVQVQNYTLHSVDCKKREGERDVE